MCGPHTDAKHSNALKKMLDMGNQQFLSLDHRFQRARTAFNGEVEMRNPPQRVTGLQILRCAKHREAFLSSKGAADSEADPVKTNGVKCVSTLYSLLYWAISNCL